MAYQLPAAGQLELSVRALAPMAAASVAPAAAAAVVTQASLPTRDGPRPSIKPKDQE